MKGRENIVAAFVGLRGPADVGIRLCDGDLDVGDRPPVESTTVPRTVAFTACAASGAELTPAKNVNSNTAPKMNRRLDANREFTRRKS